MPKKSSTTLSIVALVGALGLGLTSVATADVKWIKNNLTRASDCPSVCQGTTHYLKTPFPFAVPGGIHTHPNVNEPFYVCATYFRGWHVGSNIKPMTDRCYVAFLRGDASYGESYFCLCSDKTIEPLPQSRSGK
jgi:hypothetical protein